ncbi:sensor histidine kinase, partial [Rhizobiaceae sp. 2RAB30]
MTSALHVRRQLLGLVGSFCLLLVGFVAASAYSAETVRHVPRILILDPYDERLPATRIAGEEARNLLLKEMGGKVELFSEFLDLARFPEKEHVDRMARYFGEKYRQHRLDVVIALGAEAARFMAENRTTVASDAQIVFCGFGQETAASLSLPKDVVGVLTEFDIRKTVEMAAHLQPNARKLVVMAGSSEFDQA